MGGKFIAVLNDKMIYTGMQEVDTVPEGAVEVPAACDLAAGKYVWSPNENTFKPISLKLPFSAADSQSVFPVPALIAIGLGFAALRDAGLSLPKETLAWTAAIESIIAINKTFDRAAAQAVGEEVKASDAARPVISA